MNSDGDNEAGRQGHIRTGLIGEGILASRSPWLHESEAAALGLSLNYTLFDFASRAWDASRLPALLDELVAGGYSGCNVTFPFKQAIIPYLDDLTEEAATIGAVNTVSFRDGCSRGHNTDMYGFAEGLRRALPDVRVDRVLQLGCGGAGAAVAHALCARVGVGTLVLYDVDAERARTLAGKLAGRYGSDRIEVSADPAQAAASCDGLVNATPIGMAKYPGLPLPAEAIEPRHWVNDIIYFPLETELLKAARERGCRTLDGSRMVVHQAAEAFRIMTGHEADPDRMQRSFASFTSTPTATSG